MYANVVTWRLAEAIRAPHEYEAYLSTLAHRNIPILRQFGLLDCFVLRLSDDTIQVVNVFEDEEGAHEAWDEVSKSLAPALEGRLELIDRISVRADDLPLRLDLADDRLSPA